MVAGEAATEKSAGADPTFATKPSASPPPLAPQQVNAEVTGKPVVLLVAPARYALLLESTATAPTAPRVVFAAMLFSLPVPAEEGGQERRSRCYSIPG